MAIDARAVSGVPRFPEAVAEPDTLTAVTVRCHDKAVAVHRLTEQVRERVMEPQATERRPENPTPSPSHALFAARSTEQVLEATGELLGEILARL